MSARFSSALRGSNASGYPTIAQGIATLRARLPDIDARLATQIAAFMDFLRDQPFRKVPGIAETLDWALALTRLHRDAIDEGTLQRTLGCILKVEED